MTGRLKRRLSVALAAAMVSTFAAGQLLQIKNNFGNAAVAGASAAAVKTERYDSVNVQNVTGKVDLSSVALGNLSSAVMQDKPVVAASSAGVMTVIVKLDEPSLTDCLPEGYTVSRFLETSTGRNAAINIARSQDVFLSNLTRAGIKYKVTATYDAVLNGVAIEVDTSHIKAIKAMDGVVSASVSETYAYPEEIKETGGGEKNPHNVYATGIYDSSDFLAEYDGSGMAVAILDTGIDPTHDAFKHMPETVRYEKNDIKEAMKSGAFEATKLSGATFDDVYINAKIPFAYDYADKDADVYPSYSQHGTHVAGIVGGQDEKYYDKDGNEVNEEFLGVAPNAQLVICKVFTDDLDSKDIGGATTEDIVAALNDCVKLNVDVINMSLGTSGGFSSIAVDGDDEGLLLNSVYTGIRDAGISLICAASNEFSSGYGSNFGTNLASNPDSGTVGSPSTFDGALSVASINGQLSHYLTNENGDKIFFEDSRDQNSVAFDFLDDMLGDKKSGEFKYVVIPGTGEPVSYNNRIVAELKEGKEEGKKVIALVKRGNISFKDKVEIAHNMGADGVIVYNNVAGTVRMSLGDLKTRVPAISITLDSGLKLTGERGEIAKGVIKLDRSFYDGPFMNDYSSWGASPDLKLKPDITAHGGEIISTVAGGYDEMSGTSMASPNLAGFTALLRKYLQDTTGLSGVALNERINQIMMSTATTVIDQDDLPYSPRKQGSGLATLSNALSTKAYLFTKAELKATEFGADENRPKAELYDDKQKKGEYTFAFYVKNFGESALTFRTQSVFMTETLSKDGKAVAEKAKLLTDEPVKWTVRGDKLDVGETFTVAGGEEVRIQIELKLSQAEKKYLDNTFKNGMFVEGFAKLLSETEGQCDLTFPFMGFYGDWEQAPILDYNCFEVAEFNKDTSLKDDQRPSESVWATQPYGYYYNDKYTIPLGSFLYIQDEDLEHTPQYVYTDADHIAISRYNNYYGPESLDNYMTNTGIKALYAGLLRNCELVTYTMTNVDTGEIIPDADGNYVREKYRISKSMAAGGSAIPSQVLLELRTEELGLAANGKYRLDFSFYFKAEDAEDPEKIDKNTFSMDFYIDYEAPVLQNANIRYYDYKDGNKEKQKVFLDLEVFDNHYAQSVMLCYSDVNKEGETILRLATEYVTPVLNAVKNGTSVVSIDITNFYDKEKLYVQLDDYALNNNVYSINFTNSSTQKLPAEFEVVDGTEITIDKNTAKKIALNYEGTANPSNFTWSSNNPGVVAVKNGEIFGVKPGVAYVTVTGAKGSKQTIKVTVKDSSVELRNPSISFDTIRDANFNLVKAEGTLKINSGAQFKLNVVCDPWYYPSEKLNFLWESSDESLATVTQEGFVSVAEVEKTPTVTIKATMINERGDKVGSPALVSLTVQEPFYISNFTVDKYYGCGGELIDGKRVLKIPDDKNVMTIGEEAFRDNDNIQVIIIPKTVTQISERAFLNCTALEEVYFIDRQPLKIADAKLNLVLRNAFKGCVNLKKFDLSNCKIITLGDTAFSGCVNLETIVRFDKVGTLHNRVFAGCESLKYAGETDAITGNVAEGVNIKDLHLCGVNVFEGCTSLTSVITSRTTAMNTGMFKGCKNIESAEIYCPAIPAGAFSGCGNLKGVTIGAAGGDVAFTIGANAFETCASLETVTINGSVDYIGDNAFYGCEALEEFVLPEGDTQFGIGVFAATSVNIVATGGYELKGGAIYKGKTLVLAPTEIDEAFAIADDTEEIAAGAFTGSKLAAGVTEIIIPGSVKKIGKNAFRGLNIRSLNIPAKVTEIEDGAFAETAIAELVIGAAVKSIGANAFYGCAKLSSVTFEDRRNSALESIGSNAFNGCLQLSSITLPEGVDKNGDGRKEFTFGNYVFANCTALERVDLPALSSMGVGTFLNATSLTVATFAQDAVTTGEETFFPGFIISGDGVILNSSALKTVTFKGDEINEIGRAAFAYCTSLASFNLKGATVIGDEAFNGCTALKNISLMGVEKIGANAFTDCALENVDLPYVTHIGYGAFAILNRGDAYKSVNIPSAVYIGDYAFFGGGEKTVNISETVTYVGMSAFGNSKNLTDITVGDQSAESAANETENYISIDGVLYRKLSGGGKELCSYPSARVASLVDGVRVYTVEEGTLTIHPFAFSQINAETVTQVVLPHTLKTIGNGAFYASGIVNFRFECISAPTLLAEYLENTGSSFHSFYYINFGDNLIDHIQGYTENYSPATIRISYPSNGKGYDNYVYKNYFASALVLEEMPEEEVYEIKALISDFDSAQTIKSWKKDSAEDKQKVAALAENVKSARWLYISLSETQRKFLEEETEGGATYTKILDETESLIKTVKKEFGIPVKARSVAVDNSQPYKSKYVIGEVFDKSSVRLIVTYDDYSSESVDAEAFKVNENYEGALQEYDNMIILDGVGEYAGLHAYLTISVSKAEEKPPEGGGEPENPSGDDEPEPPSGKGEGGLPAWALAVIMAGAAVVAIGVGCAVWLLLGKGKKNKAPETEQSETEISDENANPEDISEEEIKDSETKDVYGDE